MPFHLSKNKSYLLLLGLILLLSFHWIGPDHVLAGPGMQHKAKKGHIPSSLLTWPDKSPYVILVDKSKQKVLLYQMDNPYSPLKVYRCSTGEKNGPKSKKNDRKTPEGVYFFTHSYVKRELSPIYGIRAFTIDYPNQLDTKEGRHGYGIWFHGSNKPLKPFDSNGCIVMDNLDIDELASYVKLNDTPVIINPKVEMVHPKKLKQEARELEQIIERWRTAWENKEIGRYMSFYSPLFSSGGKSWRKWRKYKYRLAKKYKSIDVKIDNLGLFKNNGTVLAKFD
ncbi:MAG: L,D-transpeptidase family protein, partial [Thermodesulfobacteriota bacterium]|nr:L,D-transpeptidase family protein [Thermodesulfobacteriota bacterium]